jgi:hypothetical protein
MESPASDEWYDTRFCAQLRGRDPDVKAKRIRSVVLWAALLAAFQVQAGQRPSPTGPPPDADLFRQLHARLGTWMTKQELARLGPPRPRALIARDINRIALDAADLAVRQLAPLPLEATGAPAEAKRLRNLPKLSDARSAAKATEVLENVSREASRRRAKVRACDVAEALAGLASELTEAFKRTPGTMPQSLPRLASLTSDAASVAIETGAPRKAVVDLMVAAYQRWSRR